MNKKVDIGSNAKVVVKWNVHQSNYTKELEKSIISLMAQKYGISEKNIRVETNYTALNECGAITSDDAKNIQLIGQFGVGFYSAFMIAEKVAVISRKAGKKKVNK